MKLIEVRITRSQRKPASFINGVGEWLFALFLFAGYYKADPRLVFIQAHVDITALFFVLSFVAFLYRGLKKPFARRIPVRFAKVAALFILLMACLTASLLYTESKQYGYDKAVRFVVLTGWAFFGTVLLITDFPSLRRFSWAIGVISTAMAIDALVGFPKDTGQERFLTAFGSDYIALARAAGIGFLAVVTFVLPNERRFLMKLALWIMATLQLWAALSAGARGPVLALILSLTLFFALSVRGCRYLCIDRYVVGLGAMVLGVLLILAIRGNEFFQTLKFRTEVLITEGGTSALERIALYQEALALWVRSPIWGIGVGQFSIEVTGEDVRLYPHNIILELGAETGLLGVLVFVMTIVVAVARPLVTFAIQGKLAKTTARYLLVECCFALLNAMVSGDLNDNRLLFTWVALLASLQRFQKDDRVRNYV